MPLHPEVFLGEPSLRLIRAGSKILFDAELKENSHTNIAIPLVLYTEKYRLTIGKKREELQANHVSDSFLSLLSRWL